MLKVKLLRNLRIYDDYTTDFMISTGEVKVIRDRDLQAYAIRGALFEGALQVVSGEFIAGIKKAHVLFSEKSPTICYGIDKVQGETKYFSRDLITQDFTFYTDPHDIPAEFLNKLEGKTEIIKITDDREIFKTEEKINEIPVDIIDDKKLMNEHDIKGLYASEQIYLIKKITDEKAPRYETKRVEMLLDLQKEGNDLRGLLSEMEE